MHESMIIELSLDEHHRLAAEGERNLHLPQPPPTPHASPRRALAATLIALVARLDPHTPHATTAPARPIGI